MNRVYYPSELPHLNKRLGSVKRKLIEKVLDSWEHPPLKEESKKGRKSNMVDNPYHTFFKNNNYYAIQHYASGVDDVISGICNLDHYGNDEAIIKRNETLISTYGSVQGVYEAGEKLERSIPLSKVLVCQLLKQPTLSTKIVEHETGLGERQSRRYLKALSLILLTLNIPESYYKESAMTEEELEYLEQDKQLIEMESLMDM